MRRNVSGFIIGLLVALAFLSLLAYGIGRDYSPDCDDYTQLQYEQKQVPVRCVK